MVAAGKLQRVARGVYDLPTRAPGEHTSLAEVSPEPRLDQPAVRVVRMSGDSLTGGIETMAIEGVRVPVFNAAKTVADCFKFRNKIGLDVALEALRDGWAQRKLTLDALWHNATINRVANVMRPYLECVAA